MLSKEDNELLTQVGPGTPMGDLFRRFWLPAMLSTELPDPDGEPVRLKLLGEELITFRDTSGRVGCVDAYCPHRGAAMFFGRNEEDGLRCIYHGWKFDVDGNCVHMPNCVEGDSYRQKLKITSYPTLEGGGLVWFYMGPADKMPPHPGFEWFSLPTDHTSAAKYIYHSNYMQALEGDFDPSHGAFLHATLNNNRNNPANRFSADAGASRAGQPIGVDPEYDPPRIEAVDYEIGVGQRRIGGTGMNRRLNAPGQGRPTWMMPCFDAVGIGPGTHPMNIKVPADDEHTIYFRVRWAESPLTKAQVEELRIGGLVNPAVEPGTFLYRDNIFNDYAMDRIKQKHFNFSGLPQTAVQDTAMQENQWGPVSKRWNEHLVSSDKIIIRVRQRLLTAAKALAQGDEPAEPWNPTGYQYLAQPEEGYVEENVPLPISLT